MPYRKKLIEVALPLEAINAESAREKSIRHGHPSTLHLWWARRPLAACRAVLFAQLVDDPSEYMPDEKSADEERERLFDLIEELVKWENINNEDVLDRARLEIARSVARDLGVPAPVGKGAIGEFLATKAPPVLDPFAGGGSIPLEAQRLGLRAYASDLNPVAVLINKALIEIPPKFAGMPPVHPPHPPAPSPHPPTPSPTWGEGEKEGKGEDRGEGEKEGKGEVGEMGFASEAEYPKWDVPEGLRCKMVEVARQFRKAPTPSEAILWQALRGKQLEGIKYRRQQPIGPFVVDFFAPSLRLVVEVDGTIHATQVEADRQRQQLLESLGLRVIRLTSQQVETDLPAALQTIRTALAAPTTPAAPPSPLAGEGGGGVEGRQMPLFKTEWKGAEGLAEDVRYYGKWMRDEAEKRIGHLYPKYKITQELLAELPDLKAQGLKPGNELTVIAWLWARTVKCPNPACGAQMPLVRSFALSTKKGKQAWVMPAIEGNLVRFTIKTGAGQVSEGTVNRNGARCICCGMPVPLDHVRAEGKAGRMSARMMAIVAEGKSGRVYLPQNSDQEAVAAFVQAAWKPEQELQGKCRVSVPLYGMNTFGDLFTPRQLTALTVFSDLVGEARQKALEDARSARHPRPEVYADAVATYLAFAVDKSSDYWSTICTWHINREIIRNTFGRQAIPMTWDYAEANPMCDSTGNWMAMVDWVWKTVQTTPSSTPGSAKQANAQELNGAPNTLVSTDPPYYDNIGYADLSDFFYIWLRRALRRVYPDLFSMLLVPKAQELVATPYRFGGDRRQAERFFEDGLRRTFHNIREISVANYPVTVFYAFKQSEDQIEESDAAQPLLENNRASTGWETMLEGLLLSGFEITGTWPMRTELANRSVGLGANALASSIVLVCRPRQPEAAAITRRELLSSLKRELPAALRQLQQGSIAPVDLAQAAIGPGMAVFSRYKQVLEADGSPMRVRTALALINQALDEFLAEQEGEYDADTRWALAWYEQYGFNEGPFGVAETLSKAKNTSVGGLGEAGILLARAGKVRLLKRDELLHAQPGGRGAGGEGFWDPSQDKRPTAWEAVQHLIRALDTHGEQGAALLLSRLGGMGEVARDLAYRLYTICERKGWAQDALGYNMLVVAWPRIKELSGKVPRQDSLL